MSNILVVDNTGATSGGELCENSAILFNTILPISSVSGAAEDPDYPFANCIDYPDNTKYSPLSESGTVEIQFNQGADQVVNCFAIAIHNAQTAGLYAKLENWNGADWDLITEFTSLKDDKPFMHVFDDTTTRRQRLTLTFTSKLYIGTIYLGKAEIGLSTPDIGFQPAKFAPLDEVEQFTTEGNNQIMGRRISRGWQARGTFGYVKFDKLDDFYEEYQNWVLDSKPVFFKWSNLRDEVVFGRQNPDRLTKPTYKTPLHSQIEFEINGYQ